MRLPGRPTALQAHLILLSVLAPLGHGCGEAALEIQLDQLPGDAPYSGLAELEAKVSRAGDLLIAHRQPMTGAPVELEPVARQDDLSIEIIGYDSDGEVAARGEVQPALPEWDGACCVLACFCTLSLFEAQQCDCGDNSCRERCQPNR